MYLYLQRTLQFDQNFYRMCVARCEDSCELTGLKHGWLAEQMELKHDSQAS